jgi:hypothetical protein
MRERERAKERNMRQLILVGALAAAGLMVAACGGLLLLAVVLFAGSGQSSYSAGYEPAFDSIQTYPIDDPQTLRGGPWQPLPDNGQWNGSISSGTVDPNRQGNDVISLDGEVLNLPY